MLCGQCRLYVMQDLASLMRLDNANDMFMVNDCVNVKILCVCVFNLSYPKIKVIVISF